jgi:SAM-dependent methyltransferase
MSDRVESQYYAFRGFDYDNARTVLSFYRQFFTDGPVLELACGPGVFLELLAEAGISASGVDIDPGMVEQATESGHKVMLQDAVEYLRTLPEGSLGGLFAAHFIEHLSAETAQEVFAEAARVLREDGVFVVAVPNAACLSVLRFDFWRDPTHVRFYDPVALEFFAREVGLEVIATGGNPRNHPGPPPQLRVAEPVPVGELVESIQEILTSVAKPAPRSRWWERRQPDPQPTLDTVQKVAHVLSMLDERCQQLQHDLSVQRTAYQNLIDELYLPNETYIVARRPGAPPPATSTEE